MAFKGREHSRLRARSRAQPLRLMGRETGVCLIGSQSLAVNVRRPGTEGAS
jgi:hypothetical protein